MNKFVPFSEKQLRLMSWWCTSSSDADKNGIICDGAVRSGKTLCMSISFVLWSFYNFSDASFALCGKTITSLRRNVITPLLPVLNDLGFSCDCKVSRNLLELTKDNRTNRFYFFGGRDEGSASLIQGMTLAGVMLDEVALMPRSFVEQALARCSVEGSKFFFNCNPEHPYHWFYLEWIKKHREKNMLYLHFTMDDNPSLSESVKARYKSLYSGVFYERFIEGKWVVADGLVYPMFDHNRHIRKCKDNISEYYLSCDYGTVNPFSLGLWGKGSDGWYRIDEYYHSSRDSGVQLTDEEYYTELKRLAQGRKISAIVIDPSAASFIQTIRRHGEYRVIKADNDVLSGIADILMKIYNTIGENWKHAGNIRYSVVCRNTEGSDSADAQARADAIAEAWSDAMSSNSVKDFVAVGDVSVSVIGADNVSLNSEIPVRQLMEQIIAKTGLPPFMLGLNWSTTERMSAQQSDILTTELESYRRIVTPVIKKIGRLYLASRGCASPLEVVWDDITLQDQCDAARAELYFAQAEKIRWEDVN